MKILSFIKYLTESKTKNPVVAVYGKIRIPTPGHNMLIDHAKDIASKHNAKVNVTLSGANKPLSLDQKKRHAERIFNHPVNIADKSTSNFVSYLSHLHNSGHDEVHIVAGSDRASEYHSILSRYNGKADKKGHVPFAFKKWQVHGVGAERIESDKHPTKMNDDEKMKTVSATKVESLAKSNDYAGFKAYYHKLPEKHVKELYNDVKKGNNE